MATLDFSRRGRNTLLTAFTATPTLHWPTFCLHHRRPLGQNSLTCHLHTAVISAPPQPRVPSLIAAVGWLHVLHSDVGYLYLALLSCLDQWFFSGGSAGRLHTSHTETCSAICLLFICISMSCCCGDNSF